MKYYNSTAFLIILYGPRNYREIFSEMNLYIHSSTVPFSLKHF